MLEKTMGNAVQLVIHPSKQTNGQVGAVKPETETKVMPKQSLRIFAKMAGIKNSRKRQDTPREHRAQAEENQTTTAKDATEPASNGRGGAQSRETKATNEGQKSPIDTGVSISGVDDAPSSSMSDDENQKREDEGRTEHRSVKRFSLDRNVRDDYEDREENTLLNQIEYIWSGITITSSHSSANLDMIDR
jgi:hypothetical protein